MSDWGEIARRFSALRPSRWVDPQALSFLNALDPTQSVLVACSGGPDSVFLTLALKDLFKESPGRLVVLHYDHGLRGEASRAEATFVGKMASELGLSFESGRPEKPLAPDEASLRKARFDWFSQVYDSLGAGALVLGHHADDLLESQLMALLSGSGPAGLSTPMPIRSFPGGQIRLRPLIGLSAEQVRTTLRELEIPSCKDPSNEATVYTRNRIRHQVVPLLKEGFPQDIQAGSLRTRLLMEECLEALDRQLAGLDLDYSQPDRFPCRNLLGLPSGLVRRALMAWWLRHYPDVRLPVGPADRATEAIASSQFGPIGSVGRTGPGDSVVKGLYLNEQADLLLMPEKAVAPASWPQSVHWHWPAGGVCLPDGSILSAKTVAWEGHQPAPYLKANPMKEAWVEGVGGPLEIRQWRAGDRYRPLGAPGSRKLQDMFTDAKLDPSEKATKPVILDCNGSILWVPGFPPADAFRICKDSNSALQLTYNPQLTVFPVYHGG